MRMRVALAALVALLLVAPVAAWLVQSSSGPHLLTAGRFAYKPTGLRDAPRAKPFRLPAGWAVVATVLRRTTMRATPGGRPLAKLGVRTEFGSPETVWVVRAKPRWLGVVSPVAGNGRVGWIERSAVSVGVVAWELRVSLSSRKLQVLHAGKVIRRYTVAIGQPDAPTPTGRFAVTDRLVTTDPSGPYGCCIVALSAHAPHAIQGWSGGDRIAIHSTPDNASIGEAVSHGCLRLTRGEARWLLAHIPLGTPTLIRS